MLYLSQDDIVTFLAPQWVPIVRVDRSLHGWTLSFVPVVQLPYSGIACYDDEYDG